MHKCASQGLKRTFMHVSGLPRRILIKKTIYRVIVFFYQSMVW